MIYRYADRSPIIGEGCFIAPSADVLGSVELGAGVSIWFGAVLRGDNDWIRIGAGSNIQDGSLIHLDPGIPVMVGANVTIGHGVMLHGCEIEDDCLIGNRATVLDGARIGAGSLIAAGALVTPRSQIPPGSVVMGSPGKVVRQVSEGDRVWMRAGLMAYQRKTREYAGLLTQIDS